MSIIRIKASVYGRVQGVGFRYFTLKKARSLNLTGYVKNEYDGSVSTVAEGDNNSIKIFLEYLREGPSFARVEKLDFEYDKPTGEFIGFDVTY